MPLAEDVIAGLFVGSPFCEVVGSVAFAFPVGAALDPHFLASVVEHGVLQPNTAVRTEAGVEVRDGQRRTFAAREAKLLTIPVYVLDGQLTDEKAATAERPRRSSPTISAPP